MSLKILWRMYLVVFAAFLLPVSAFADVQIDGIWSSSERTNGGLGGQWVFTEDGKVTYTFGALVDFKYVINDNVISVTLHGPSSDSGGNVIKQVFSIKDNTLIIRAEGENKDQVMGRVSRIFEGKHPIVGDWTYTHNTGKPAVMRYRDDGTVQLSVPFGIDTGTYKVNDREIEINIKNKKPYTCQFDFEPNKLTFIDKDNGKVRQYIRLSD